MIGTLRLIILKFVINNSVGHGNEEGWKKGILRYRAGLEMAGR